MSQQELLKKVIPKLDALGIPSMVTGSVVTSLQGHPRMTHDADIVVELGAGQIDQLLGDFPPPDFYLSRHAIVEAIRTGRMFNLLEIASGDKVDFWMLTGSAFDRSRFARRRTRSFEGVRAAVSTPEDTILKKLAWCVEHGHSERHFFDAIQVFEVQADVLDRDYVERWLDELKVRSLWNRILSEAKPVQYPGRADSNRPASDG